MQAFGLKIMVLKSTLVLIIMWNSWLEVNYLVHLQSFASKIFFH